MDKLNLAGDTAGVEVSENKPEVEGTVKLDHSNRLINDDF